MKAFISFDMLTFSVWKKKLSSFIHLFEYFIGILIKEYFASKQKTVRLNEPHPEKRPWLQL